MSENQPATTLADRDERRLDETEKKIVDAARAAWPGVDLSTTTYLDRLEAFLEPNVPREDALRSLQTSDLYLSIACSEGLPSAIQAFERAYFAEIDAILRRTRAQGFEADDVRQMLREKLFLNVDGKLGKIGSYRGKGELGAWFRVVATRTILNASTRAPKEVLAKEEEDRVFVDLPAHGGSELDIIRAGYADELRSIFPAAFARLDVRERLLLKQRYLDALSLDEMSTLHGVHRATIKRQMASARETLTRALRDLLMAKLKISPAEFESIMRLMRSRFHITVRRLLMPNEGSDR